MRQEHQYINKDFKTCEDDEQISYNKKRIEERHNEIIQLENDARDVCEMFYQAKQLVESQQSPIDKISVNIENSYENTINAEREIEKAEYLLNKRKKCCFGVILFCCLLLLILILLFSLLK
jgi:t-SNARE complex subunit (syntaxin)